MKEEYLPIGSVCTLYKNNTKVMITGYLTIKYDDGLKIYKYKGVDYPDGVLSTKQHMFNEEDIKKIDFVGYKSNEYTKLNDKLKVLNLLKLEDTLGKVEKNLTMNLEFDENGIVIAQNVSENEEIDNPFNTYKNESKMFPKPDEDTKNWPIFNKKIQFDENGTVIAVEDETESTLETKDKVSKIQFDENGTVIAVEDETESTPEIKDKVSKIQFDENGTVIAVEDETESTPETKDKVSKIQFDENGTVIAVGDETESTPETKDKVSKIQFDENGTVIAVGDETESTPEIKDKVSKIQFDENGTVIAVE